MEVPEQTLRRYLLGYWTDSEGLPIDERLLTDDKFAARVQLAESALIDDFVLGKLDPDEEKQFYRVFLVTPARRRALELASSIRHHSVTMADLPPTDPSFQLFLKSSSGRAMVVSFSLALVIGLVWLIYKLNQPSELIVRAPATNSSPVVPETPSPKPSASLSPSSQNVPAPATVASFVLLPGALRADGEMTRVIVPGGDGDSVRLTLVLETPAAGTYLAVLVTAEGQSVLVRPNLKPVRNGQPKVTLTVPARLLDTRDYQIKLSRKTPDGQIESVGRYYFRALDE